MEVGELHARGETNRRGEDTLIDLDRSYCRLEKLADCDLTFSLGTLDQLSPANEVYPQWRRCDVDAPPFRRHVIPCLGGSLARTSGRDFLVALGGDGFISFSGAPGDDTTTSCGGARRIRPGHVEGFVKQELSKNSVPVDGARENKEYRAGRERHVKR